MLDIVKFFKITLLTAFLYYKESIIITVKVRKVWRGQTVDPGRQFISIMSEEHNKGGRT